MGQKNLEPNEKEKAISPQRHRGAENTFLIFLLKILIETPCLRASVVKISSYFSSFNPSCFPLNPFLVGQNRQSAGINRIPPNTNPSKENPVFLYPFPNNDLTEIRSSSTI